MVRDRRSLNSQSVRVIVGRQSFLGRPTLRAWLDFAIKQAFVRLPSRYGQLFPVTVYTKPPTGATVFVVWYLALSTNGVLFVAHIRLAIHRATNSTAATIAIVRAVRSASASSWLP